MKNPNERLKALQILIQIFQNKRSIAELIPSGSELSPFSKELCYGVCRYYYRLQAFADALLRKKQKDEEVYLCLLLGLYQIYYLRSPDYAVVKETVDLLSAIKKPALKGFVNAVLRNFCRQKEVLEKKLIESIPFQNNHPDWLVERLQAQYPQDFKTILSANDQHAPMSLRLNSSKQSMSAYLQLLEDAGIPASKHRFASSGLELEKATDVYELPGFTEGLVSVQDQAAQLAVSLLDLKPGLRVLDACAAPGGKTGHILETESALESLTAVDLEAKRLRRVEENLKRLNLKAKLIQADILEPQSWWDGQLFDRILLDAPCSATGVIRRHPDIKILRTKAELENIVKIQAAMLKTLWPLLAPGGLLVYATCSVLSEENEGQIAQFIASHTGCQFIDQDRSWGRKTGHGFQILPGEENMDGFFYSILRKSD